MLESIGDLPIVDTEIREVQERSNHFRTLFLLFFPAQSIIHTNHPACSTKMPTKI